MGLGVGEADIAVTELKQAGLRIGAVALIPHDQRVEPVQGPPVDLQDQVVQVLEHQIEGAHRVADGAGHLACAQCLVALGGDDIFRRCQGHLPDLLPAVVAASCHLMPLENLY